MILKIKNLSLILSIILLTFLTGCSNDSKDKEQKNKTTSKEVAAPKIEIVKNENAHMIKVESKAVDENQSQSYYYDYNKKKVDNQETKTRTALDANLHVKSPYDEVRVSLLVKKLSKEFIVKCSACHNDYANGIIGPSLLGKDADFIYGAIAKFKTGEEENILMTDLIKKMSDKQIRALANEISDFNEQVKALNKE